MDMSTGNFSTPITAPSARNIFCDFLLTAEDTVQLLTFLSFAKGDWLSFISLDDAVEGLDAAIEKWSEIPEDASDDEERVLLPAACDWALFGENLRALIGEYPMFDKVLEKHFGPIAS